MAERLVFPIPDGAKRAQCRGCHAWGYWIVTKAGKRMLVEADGENRGESHFARCPDAKHFRKAGR